MPQFLRFEVKGVELASMKTSHRSGTSYAVEWRVASGVVLSLHAVDTGVQCQSGGRIKRQQDFRNDFIQARRAVAAASLTAEQFLRVLQNSEGQSDKECDAVVIRLCTNQIDRGTIIIQAEHGCGATLCMRIGTGPRRPPNAKPTQVEQFCCKPDDIPGKTSALALALQLLADEREWLMRSLQGR